MAELGGYDTVRDGERWREDEREMGERRKSGNEEMKEANSKKGQETGDTARHRHTRSEKRTGGIWIDRFSILVAQLVVIRD